MPTPFLVTMERLGEICRSVSIPVVAIGGHLPGKYWEKLKGPAGGNPETAVGVRGIFGGQRILKANGQTDERDGWGVGEALPIRTNI